MARGRSIDKLHRSKREGTYKTWLEEFEEKKRLEKEEESKLRKKLEKSINSITQTHGKEN